MAQAPSQNDQQLNSLLRWGIENSNPSSDSAVPPPKPLDPQVIASLFGGPSDADLMKAAMECLQEPDSTMPLSEKLIAFDNLEQLVEGIDNANNLAPLGLWTPLIGLLDHKEAEMRRMAAWCIGTAVQNNPACQERALVGGAIEKLVPMARKTGAKGEDEAVRRKARYATSSCVRNFQPGLEACISALGQEQKVDAGDMEAVDRLMDELSG